MTRYEKMYNELKKLNEKIFFDTPVGSHEMAGLIAERTELEDRIHNMSVQEAHEEVTE